MGTCHFLQKLASSDRRRPHPWITDNLLVMFMVRVTSQAEGRWQRLCQAGVAGRVGRLQHWDISPSLQGFQVAYVVFQKPSGVSAALALKGPLLVSTESHPVKSGIQSQYCGRVGGLFPGPWFGGGGFVGAASAMFTCPESSVCEA